MTETVGSLGEAGVLSRVLRHLSGGDAVRLGPGDDCAVVRFAGDSVVTTDTMIEGSDFRLDWHEPEELGWKLAATNLSDVASMGARPVALTLALACPSDTSVFLLEGIARGVQRACDELAPGCAVAGGDLASAPQLVGAVTAFGDLEGQTPVTRDGARLGDTVAYAGELGLSRVGLQRLFAEGSVVAREKFPVEVRAHFMPTPPVSVAVSAGINGATAMMDVSDGLLLDGARLGEASRVTLDYSTELLENAFGVQQGVRVAVNDLLVSGEDHGFLATFPPDVELPEGFQAIGRARERSASITVDGEAVVVTGWDPFQHSQA